MAAVQSFERHWVAFAIFVMVSSLLTSVARAGRSIILILSTLAPGGGAIWASGPPSCYIYFLQIFE